MMSDSNHATILSNLVFTPSTSLTRITTHIVSHLWGSYLAIIVGIGCICDGYVLADQLNRDFVVMYQLYVLPTRNFIC